MGRPKQKKNRFVRKPPSCLLNILSSLLSHYIFYHIKKYLQKQRMPHLGHLNITIKIRKENYRSQDGFSPKIQTNAQIKAAIPMIAYTNLDNNVIGPNNQATKSNLKNPTNPQFNAPIKDKGFKT